MRVPVDDEYLFTVRSPVHGDFLPYPVMRAIVLNHRGPDCPANLRRNEEAGPQAGLQRLVLDIGQGVIHVAETRDPCCRRPSPMRP